MDKKILDQQSQYWEKNFLSKPEMFGLEPSKAAVNTLKTFKEQNIKKIVELGAGLGRDTIFFASFAALLGSKPNISGLFEKLFSQC